MRKLHYIFAGLVLVFALGSCEKQNKHDLFGDDAMKAAKSSQIFEVGPSIPVSQNDGPNGTEPWIIYGENKGGNRTCIDVFNHFAPDAECGVDFLCGDKVDYDEDGDGFGSGFDHYPGLSVEVEGKYISFAIPGCIEIDQKLYKVGAVIVKGSNAANVYFYPGGTSSDWGLAAPGDKHMVSNLTFCFVPCEDEKIDLALALKAFVDLPREEDEPRKTDVIHTIGTDLPEFEYVEYATYTMWGGLQTYVLNSELDGLPAGTMTVDVEYDATMKEYVFVVQIDTDNPLWLFNANGCYFYIGPLPELLLIEDKVDFPYKNYSPDDYREFRIPVSEVIPTP